MSLQIPVLHSHNSFSISIFLNFPKPSWCLYAQRVPEGTYNVHFSILIPSNALLSIDIFSISFACE